MIDQLDVARVVAFATLAVLTATLALVAAGAVLRFVGRRPGRRWSAALWWTTGVVLGLVFLQDASNTLLRVGLIALIGGSVLWLLWHGRRVRAGLLLAGAGIPWALLWGASVLLILLAEADFAPFLTAAMFAIGLVVVGLGLGLVAARDPAPVDPGPTPAAREDRRVGLVAETVLAPELVGSIPVSELASMLVTVAAVLLVAVIGLPGGVEPVVQVVVGGLAGNEARFLVRPRPARRAFEAFSWLGEWELDRLRALTGLGPPVGVRAAEGWLRRLPDRPDTDWMRVDALGLLGRIDEARIVANRMPAGTPYQRFERAHALDLVDWLAGGPGDPDALRDAAEAVGAAGSDDRLRAEVAVALRSAARIAAATGPETALQPLLEIRDRLGPRADGQLRRALWRRYLPVSLVTAGIATLILYPF